MIQMTVYNIYIYIYIYIYMHIYIHIVQRYKMYAKFRQFYWRLSLVARFDLPSTFIIETDLFHEAVISSTGVRLVKSKNFTKIFANKYALVVIIGH